MRLKNAQNLRTCQEHIPEAEERRTIFVFDTARNLGNNLICFSANVRQCNITDSVYICAFYIRTSKFWPSLMFLNF